MDARTPRVLSGIYRLGEKSRVAEGHELSKGFRGGIPPPKFFEMNMRLQRLDEIHAGPSFLLRNQEEDKRRLYWQDEK